MELVRDEPMHSVDPNGFAQPSAESLAMCKTYTEEFVLSTPGESG